MRKAPLYTKEQDDIIAQEVVEHLKEGQTRFTAFRVASKRLGRDTAAVERHWGKIKDKYQQRVDHAIEVWKQKKKHGLASETTHPEDSCEGLSNEALLRIIRSQEEQLHKQSYELESQRKRINSLEEKLGQAARKSA